MDFNINVSTDDEFADIPEKAIFTIDVNTKKLIQELAHIAEVNNLYKLEKFDYRVEWFDDDDKDVVTEADILNVSCSDFWFSAYLKHTNIEIVTERISIVRLDGNQETDYMQKVIALKLVGGLSETSKMPGKSFGLPTAHCSTGSAVAKFRGKG